MKKIITLCLLLVTLLVIYTIIYSQKQDNTLPKRVRTPLTDTELMAKYQAVIRTLNLTTKITGCSKSTAKIKLLEEEYEPTRDAKVRKITGPIEMIFDSYTGEVYSISNRVIEEKRFGGKSPAKYWYDKKPTKTKDEIKEVCQGILQEVAPQYTLMIKKCDFISRCWAAGIWGIMYYRVRNDYKYYEDGIKISLIEEYGLFSYSNFCTSSICPTDVKTPKERAEKTALEFARKLISAKQVIPAAGMSFNKWFKGFEIAGVLSQKLMIVNPNYILTNKSRWGTNKRTRNARLAWVFTIEAKHIENANIVEKEIYIWIDATTGEILGGDFTL